MESSIFMSLMKITPAAVVSCLETYYQMKGPKTNKAASAAAGTAAAAFGTYRFLVKVE